MKALTIWQPWASLIMAGAKPVEWRGWACPRWIVGQRIAIHAGARRVTTADIVDILGRIADGETSLDPILTKELLLTRPKGAWPLSSVLGTAIIGAPIPVLDWLRDHAPDFLDSDRIDHSKFAWPLTDIERFEPPIPARGAQGFWDWHG